jgi:hypothetical protein
LVAAYQDLLKGHADYQERISFRFTHDEKGEAHITYINRMTIHRFRKILLTMPFQQRYYYEDPLRKMVAGIRSWPVCREWLTKMVVCVLQKPVASPIESTSS